MTRNPRGRRTAAETPKEAIRRQRRRRASLTFSTILVAGLLAALVLLTLGVSSDRRASRTIASESGTVEGNGSGHSDPYYNGLRISEVMASNHTSVTDENGRFADWVEVWNASDRVINLEGVGLSDRSDSVRFLFPDIELKPDGRVIVFCDNTNKVVEGEPLHAKFKLSSVGETVYLYDKNAYEIDVVKYGIVGSDTSWSLLADGSYAEVPYFSPGFDNTENGNMAYRASMMVTDGALIINEIMPNAKSGLADEDGEFSDWVELYNTTDETISLDGYALSDKESKPLKWRFPKGAVIAPHGYYVVFCSGKDRNDDPTAYPHANFLISAEHDTVVLAAATGRIADRVTIDNIPEDCSYARDRDGAFSVHKIATPGRGNDDIAGADADLRSRNMLGVYISEVMASNDTTATGAGELYTDWIEIYNGSGDSVDLSGYGLSDNIGRARKWQFPTGTLIGAGEYKLIYCDGNTAASSSSQIHTSYRILRAGGETVCLSDPTGHILDRIVLPLVPTNVSYGRTWGSSGFFYYDAPTPGRANGSGFRGYAQTPDLLEPGGMYYQTVYTGITIPDGCEVFYTTDGSIPTRSSYLYTGETLELSQTGVIRARAYSMDSSVYPSEIVSATYLVNVYHTMPVACIVVDPDELYNEDRGLLVFGKNGVKEAPGKLPFKNTVYREFGKIPRPGHLEYYTQEGQQLLNQDMQFSLMGAYSLDMPQKSMKFRAKSLYGAKTFKAALFEDRPFTEYKGIVLRNSGNDCMFTRLQDGFQSRLLDAYGTQVIHTAWKPVIVYINGVYWGHMNLRERVDRFFVAQHEGIPLEEADQMTILEASGSVKYGTSQDRRDWRSFISKVKAGNPAKNQSDLQYILDNVDVDNYLEYMALEMFVGNSDPGNTRWYRLDRKGSKWRWIWYDADYGLFNSSFNSPRSYTKAKGMGDQNIDNTLLLKLLTVPEYRDLFFRKLGSVFQTFTTDYMLSVLEPLVQQITPEMGMHWARWGELNDKMVISEVPTTADGAYNYWLKRVERLRNTLRKRPNLLWDNIQDQFGLTHAQMVEYFGERPAMPDNAI